MKWTWLTRTCYFLGLSTAALGLRVWASDIPCPIALGNFGRILQQTLLHHHDIREDDLKVVGEHPAISPGAIHERVSRGLYLSIGPGQAMVLRYVFGGNGLFFYRQPMTASGEMGSPQLQQVIPLNHTGPWEERKISYPVTNPNLSEKPLMMAYATGDQISVINVLNGQRLQTYTTQGAEVLSITLTQNYLLAGLSDRLLVFFPHQHPLDPSVPQIHDFSMGLPGPAEVILQSHFTDQIGPDGQEALRAPLTLVVSGHQIFFLGHEPNFEEVLLFPTATLSGRITHARIEDFGVPGSSFDRRFIVLRIKKDDQTSKVLVLDSLVSRFEPERLVLQLGAKTLPGLQVLPQFLHLNIPHPPQSDQLVLVVATSDITSGILLTITPQGRIPREPLTLQDVRPGIIFYPYTVPGI